MIYLFFDTETTDLPDFKKQATDPSQPHILQLAAILIDQTGLVLAEINLLVKPDGWTINPKAEAVHGISMERATKYGLKLGTVVKLFLALADKADLLVAHSFDFDEKMIRRELHHLGEPQTAEAFRDRKNHCTMKQGTALCKIPSARGGFKWPKLQELHGHLFGVGFEDAHDAMADIRATVRCFFEMNKPEGSATTPPTTLFPATSDERPDAPLEVD